MIYPEIKMTEGVKYLKIKKEKEAIYLKLNNQVICTIKMLLIKLCQVIR